MHTGSDNWLPFAKKIRTLFAMENGVFPTVYRQFIEKFASKIDTLTKEDSETPFRLVTFCLVPSEVEAECLEWIRRYLSLQ